MSALLKFFISIYFLVLTLEFIDTHHIYCLCI